MKAQFLITIKNGLVQNITSNQEVDYVIINEDLKGQKGLYASEIYGEDQIVPNLDLDDYKDQ